MCWRSTWLASTASASPALSASSGPYSAGSVARPRRRRLASTMSSWTRNALCSISMVTAIGKQSASEPPNARQVARQSAGRKALLGRRGYSAHEPVEPLVRLAVGDQVEDRATDASAPPPAASPRPGPRRAPSSCRLADHELHRHRDRIRAVNLEEAPVARRGRRSGRVRRAEARRHPATRPGRQLGHGLRVEADRASRQRPAVGAAELAEVEAQRPDRVAPTGCAARARPSPTPSARRSARTGPTRGRSGRRPRPARRSAASSVRARAPRAGPSPAASG